MPEIVVVYGYKPTTWEAEAGEFGELEVINMFMAYEIIITIITLYIQTTT